ncbi:sphingosine kinase 1-like [Limulus polyphemus]|uniref:Sphingosine kinase 1-like n=1 Tax=Limulus polyphemus TaxID=6850 RepID=A0ABM1C1G7_LIMPO|nr:sphingosine kinase 1-like [Limulus polyphemus]
MLEPVTSSVMNIIRGNSQKTKLILLQTADDATCSLSSLEWGLVADIILEAEALRCFGEARYGLSGMVKSLSPKKYRCRLSFLRATEENRAKMALARKSTLLRLYSDPICNNQQKNYFYQGRNSKCSASRQTSFLSQEAESIGLEEGYGSSSRLLWKTVTSLLPSWVQPVPDDWETIEEDFYMVACSYVSRLSAYLSLAPVAKHDDDTIWLTLLRGDIPRIFIPYILIAMRNGKHVNLSAIDTIPILAFRLEPLDSGCDFTVDGDFLKGGILQGEILPFTLNIMSR